MTSRFSPPRRSERSGWRWTLITCLSAVAGFAGGSPDVWAQAPSPSPKVATAYVRFWNMLPQQTGSLGSMQLLSGEDKVVATAPPANYYAGYTSVPPGSYNFSVRPAGSDTTLPKKLPVILRGEVYITVLVSEKNGQPSVEWIDDTYDTTKTPEGRVVIRSFVPGARVNVLADGRVSSGEVAYGESRVIDNLPPRLVNLSMQALIASQGPGQKTWAAEADLSTTRHATLLIVSDPYGRFRPRVAMDGPKVEPVPAR